MSLNILGPWREEDHDRVSVKKIIGHFILPMFVPMVPESLSKCRKTNTEVAVVGSEKGL